MNVRQEIPKSKNLVMTVNKRKIVCKVMIQLFLQLFSTQMNALECLLH